MAVGAVVARILTQYSDKGSKAAQKDLMKLGKSFDAYAKKASRAVGLVAVATAAAAVKIGKDSVMAASDVSQQFGALDAVFKSNSKELKDFSKTMVEYGLSTADSARFSALLGTQLTGLGLTQTDAIKKTKDLQILGADLAATFGGTTADAVAAFGSVLKGEYNPIERYGVAIKKSDITARVAAKGLKGLTGETLKQAEAQSALELIFEKTTAAQGQAMREYGTLAAQLQRLDASYTNIQASLGEALLPVVQEFAAYLLKDVIPGIQKWVDLNKTQLSESLKNAAKLAGSFLKVAGKIAQWATDNIGAVKNIAIAIASMFVVTKAVTFFTTVLQMITSLKALKIQADQTSAATSKVGLLGKVGAVAAVASIAIPGYQALTEIAEKQLNQTKDLKELEKQLFTAQLKRDPLAMSMIKKRIDALKSEIALTEKLRQEQLKSVDMSRQQYGGAAAVRYEAEKAASEAVAQAKAEAAAAEQAAKSAAAALVASKKDEALKKKIAKGQAALTKFGIKTTEENPIQLEAARLNLVKQGNLAEAARLAAISKTLELQLEANKALARYNDLLAALADKEISSDEVLLLSKKWNMTIEATQSYIQTLLAVSDQTISDDEITNLAKSWGVSKDQASRYLDFFNALNDGKLSDAEIAKLQTKWGLTSKEVQIYADLITKASDYVLSDAEITALGTNWGLTTKEVIEYIKKLGQPVTFSGTLIDPATQAELGWKNALAALLAYQAALAGKAVSSTSSSSSSSSSSAASTTNSTASTVASTTAATASAASAIAYAVAKATGDETKAALAAAGVTPSALAMKESGAIGALSIATQLKAAEQTVANASSLSAFKAKEAADLAASVATAKEVDYDERFRFRSSVMDNSKGIVGSSMSAAPIVNVTVNGSVSTEQDLVAAVRQGLLATQTNGNTLTLQAI